MANQRGSGRKLIPVPASEQFIRELHHALRKAGFSNRSQFIRDAIVEKLGRLGLVIRPGLAVPAHRPGKGGRLAVPSQRTPDKTAKPPPALKKTPARRAK
jgi:hypothetical protein